MIYELKKNKEFNFEPLLAEANELTAIFISSRKTIQSQINK
jgi:hypothetical protein